MFRRGSAAALAFLVLPGCAVVLHGAADGTRGGIVRRRAASDFACPADRLTITELAGTSYRVEGCSRTAVYDCMASDVQDGEVDNYACVPENPGQSAAQRSPR